MHLACIKHTLKYLQNVLKSDMNINIGKASTAINRLPAIEKSDLSE